MRLVAVAAVLGLAAPAFSYTHKYVLSYDALYDDGHTSLKNVTCARGEHGLLTHGYNTFESLPTFPHIGGAPQILGENSQFCGSCWHLTYTDHHGSSTSLNFTAIAAGEHGSDDFISSLKAIDFLTHGHGKELHQIPIKAARKPKSWCGL